VASENLQGFFVKWYKKRGRYFPWREEGTSPFAILLTEIMLRQTRAASVARLWHRFIDKYPTPNALARASESSLVKQLRTLGFGNMRSLALLGVAKWLLDHHDGNVPDGLQELLSIPHVGSYASRAVLCFAFGQKVEIVDNNVQRFFARYYGLQVRSDIRRNPHVVELARQALPKSKKLIRQHNYGLLDFTAEVCKPGKPRCGACPLNQTCCYANNL
jgi:A/G-specific adenine glycosylase